ncbi:MAG: phosphoribosyltransferase [Chitinivibrionales bacterium]|nr:phosphoribosyltransferase [Chitinivibrionales bacterium]
MERIFGNRREAGRILADHLKEYKSKENLLVLGLPRGGVPVAFEVAKALDADLDIFVVRKLDTPGHEELAMGAIAGGDTRVINEDVVEYLHIPEDAIEMETRREQEEVRKREAMYREGGKVPVSAEGRPVILVDDGLATGASMMAAVKTLRQQNPSAITVAVPVASPSVRNKLAEDADDIICVQTPRAFSAVGAWYDDFTPTTDEEVKDLLKEWASMHQSVAGS